MSWRNEKSARHRIGCMGCLCMCIAELWDDMTDRWESDGNLSGFAES